MDQNNNKNLISEIWDFLKVRKAWWLAPIIVVLIVIGGLLIVSNSAAVSPFIYILF